jgi:perosamine synthetase
LAQFYNSELHDVPGLTPAPIVPGANYVYYTVRVERRDEIGFSQLMDAKGIKVGQVYERVLPFRERFRSYVNDSYPNTVQATRQVVNLPIHPRLKMVEAQYIVECARDILRQSV